MVKVHIIDEHEIERLGRAAVLGRLGHDVTALAWSELAADVARTSDGNPGDPDVVLAVLRPDETSWDRYASIGTLRRIRTDLGRRDRVVAALSPTASANPLLRMRLQRAGVTEVIGWSALPDSVSLEALLRRRLRTRSPAPTPMELALVGVGPSCDPDGLVAMVQEWARSEPAVLRAFEPGVQQNQCGLSRRGAHRLRSRLAEAGAVRAMGVEGGGPARNRSLARWAEVIAVANLCRGWEPVGPAIQELPGFREHRTGEVAFA